MLLEQHQPRALGWFGRGDHYHVNNRGLLPSELSVRMASQPNTYPASDDGCCSEVTQMWHVLLDGRHEWKTLHPMMLHPHTHTHKCIRDTAILLQRHWRRRNRIARGFRIQPRLPCRLRPPQELLAASRARSPTAAFLLESVASQHGGDHWDATTRYQPAQAISHWSCPVWRYVSPPLAAWDRSLLTDVADPPRACEGQGTNNLLSMHRHGSPRSSMD